MFKGSNVALVTPFKNDKLDVNSISKFAPKIVEGTKKLKLWSESL